jgi:hypothetical protein
VLNLDDDEFAKLWQAGDGKKGEFTVPLKATSGFDDDDDTDDATLTVEVTYHDGDKTCASVACKNGSHVAMSSLIGCEDAAAVKDGETEKFGARCNDDHGDLTVCCAGSYTAVLAEKCDTATCSGGIVPDGACHVADAASKQKPQWYAEYACCAGFDYTSVDMFVAVSPDELGKEDAQDTWKQSMACEFAAAAKISPHRVSFVAKDVVVGGKTVKGYTYLIVNVLPYVQQPHVETCKEKRERLQREDDAKPKDKRTGVGIFGCGPICGEGTPTGETPEVDATAAIALMVAHFNEVRSGSDSISDAVSLIDAKAVQLISVCGDGTTVAADGTGCGGDVCTDDSSNLTVPIVIGVVLVAVVAILGYVFVARRRRAAQKNGAGVPLDRMAFR